jgi:O-antigen/teichoic acid export membrane protein
MTEVAAATTTPAPVPPASTMRRDVISAYVASAARVGSWVIVSAIVMRCYGTSEFAVLALVRGTLSILNYGTLGLGPAMVHHLSGAGGERGPQVTAPRPVVPVTAATADSRLAYLDPARTADPLGEVLRPLRATYAAGLKIAAVAAVVSAILLYGYATNFDQFHELPRSVGATRVEWFVLFMGLGAILRLAGDAPAAVLQVRDRIAYDNQWQALAEMLWVAGVAATTPFGSPFAELVEVGFWFFVSGGVLLVGRLMAAAAITRMFVFDLPRAAPGLGRALLATGGVVVAGQLADYLYAPANLILINRLLDPELVAYYAPALQIDGALLLLVTALGAVLMPKAAVAHAADDRQRVWRYYVRGTLVSLAMLAAAAVVIVLLSPWLLPLWLGREMPATRAILPLVMIHTVVGGSGAVGRSILIAIGRAKAFTIAALVAGVFNVVLAYVFAARVGLGLKGIVLATVIVVVARAGTWQPWYVRRALRKAPLVPSPGTPGEG